MSLWPPIMIIHRMIIQCAHYLDFVFLLSFFLAFFFWPHYPRSWEMELKEVNLTITICGERLIGSLLFID